MIAGHMARTVFKRRWKGADGERREAWVYKVSFRHPDGRVETIRRRAQVQRREAAKSEADDVLAALRAGTLDAHRDSATFAAVARAFLKARDLAGSTRTRYEDSVERVLVPAFGRKPVGDVGAADLEAFKRAHDEEWEASTTAGHLNVARAVLNWAHEAGKRDAPAPRVKSPKDRRPDAPPRWFTPDEWAAIVKAADGAIREWIIVAAKTGLRRSEMFGLRWRDVDLKGRLLHVREAIVDDVEGVPKSGQGRAVPLSGEACAVLEGRTKGKPEAFVFPEFRTKGSLRRPLEAISQAVGFSVSAHDFRHHFGSSAVRAAIPLRTVQAWLGHASLRMTERYTRHAVPSASIDLLDTPAPKRRARGAKAGAKAGRKRRSPSVERAPAPS
jgi:integrase